MSWVVVREGLLVTAAIVFLGLMVASGGRGEREQFVAYEAAGVMQASPASVQRVAVRSQSGEWVFTRAGQRWVLDDTPLAAASEARLTTALQYLHVTRPIRVLAADDATALSEYGLVAPRLNVAIQVDDGRSSGFTFGDGTPVGGQQYVRVTGETDIYLLSDFIGAEWEALVDALR